MMNLLKITMYILTLLIITGCMKTATNLSNKIYNNDYKYTFYKNGNKKWKNQYSNGLLDGKQLRYNKNGNIEVIEVYNYGKLEKIEIIGSYGEVSWENREVQDETYKEYDIGDI